MVGTPSGRTGTSNFFLSPGGSAGFPARPHMSGPWASGGLWSSESRCPPGSAICGLQTKIQPFAGAGVTYDDAGLTDLKFICCET